MMTWNYRVVMKDGFFGIHSVHYDDNGKRTHVSVDPIFPFGDTEEELKLDFEYFKLAFDSPVLDYTKDIPEEGAEEE